MSGRKKRLANGRLRPAAARSKLRRTKAKREAWLARFAPGERERFFNHVVVEEAVFLAGFARDLGLERGGAAALLDDLAEARGWRRLRTLDGTVVGIAPARRDRPKAIDLREAA